LIGSAFFDLKNIFYIWHFNSFLVFLTSMEIIIYSPNFYLHLQDALVIVQYFIDGIFQLAAQIKI
jgi:hypothetical protein|tara:strand:+ start:985 stop:1179 length:195 start_codon:yes stop_codon:yes gene_type:complete